MVSRKQRSVHSPPVTAAAREHKIWKPRPATRLAILGLYAGDLVTGLLWPSAHGTASGAQYWLSLVVMLGIGGFVVWKTLSGSLWARKLTLIYSAFGALTAYQLLTPQPGRALAWVLTAGGVVIAAATFWLVKRDTPGAVVSPESQRDPLATRRRSRSGRAIRLFAAAGTSFLVAIIGIAFSGGGLSRGTLSEPLNGVAVAATWVALLAVVVLLPLAVLTGLVTIVRSWTAPDPAAAREDDQPREVPKRGIGTDVSELQVVLRDRRLPDVDPSAVGPLATKVDRRQMRAVFALIALTIAGAYLWSETAANPSLEVMPFAIVVLGSSLVFAWVIIRTK